MAACGFSVCELTAHSSAAKEKPCSSWEKPCLNRGINARDLSTFFLFVVSFVCFHLRLPITCIQLFCLEPLIGLWRKKSVCLSHLVKRLIAAHILIILGTYVSLLQRDFKGHLLCKIHLFMSSLHHHVSPLWKEILKVSGKKILSLFVLIHFYKNLSENELIRF